MLAYYNLRSAAKRIAASKHELPATPLTALRKLFIIQERRDWLQSPAPRIGWKRGELAEVLTARSRAELAEEWGDCGYYIAQTWEWLWRVYALSLIHI